MNQVLKDDLIRVWWKNSLQLRSSEKMSHISVDASIPSTSDSTTAPLPLPQSVTSNLQMIFFPIKLGKLSPRQQNAFSGHVKDTKVSLATICFNSNSSFMFTQFLLHLLSSPDPFVGSAPHQTFTDPNDSHDGWGNPNMTVDSEILAGGFNPFERY